MRNICGNSFQSKCGQKFGIFQTMYVCPLVHNRQDGRLLKSNSFKLTIIFVSSFHLTFWLLLELSFLISSPRHFVYLCHWCIKNSFCQKIMKTIFTLSKGHNMLCKCVQLCNYANLMETWWSMNLLYRKFIFFRLKMAQKSSKRHRGNFEVVTAQPFSL